MCLHDDSVFVGRPLLLSHRRAKLVMPAFTALLADTPL